MDLEKMFGNKYLVTLDESWGSRDACESGRGPRTVPILPGADMRPLGEPRARKFSGGNSLKALLRRQINMVQNGTAYGHRPNAPCDANVRRRRAYGAREF